MTVPITPPEASIPLPASRVSSPSGASRHRLEVSDLAMRRSRMRSPLRSTSLPTSDDAGEGQKEQGGTTRMASRSKLDTSASSPVSVSIRGDYQMKRPFIVRSSTSTSTVCRESSSSVPPPMSSRRLDYEDMVKQEQAREENEAQDDFYKERGWFFRRKCRGKTSNIRGGSQWSSLINLSAPSRLVHHLVIFAWHREHQTWALVGHCSQLTSCFSLFVNSRKGLYIVDVQYPEQVPRCVPQGGMWQVAE
jgi:hypothetical protein